MLMKKIGNTPFDADAALKAARLTVLALCSLWKSDIQESDRQEVVALAVAKAPDTLMVEDESLERLMRVIASLPEPIQRVLTLLSEGKRPREPPYWVALPTPPPSAAAGRAGLSAKNCRKESKKSHSPEYV